MSRDTYDILGGRYKYQKFDSFQYFLTAVSTMVMVIHLNFETSITMNFSSFWSNETFLSSYIWYTTVVNKLTLLFAFFKHDTIIEILADKILLREEKRKYYDSAYKNCTKFIYEF